ncbi:MAG: SAM-dependent methyltransferase [Flavobacteriaceae bacterium]|nr:SAM-dependent methyltransferase [Flavobacteriaceae bacterium]
MNYKQTYSLLGNMDIYVIDQILKERYTTGQSILDAGCGYGRNLKWFYQNNFSITGIDTNADAIKKAQEIYPAAASNFRVGTLEMVPFEENYFDHIICCAVLHFADNNTHFNAMVAELVRVLKYSGTLFIRVASNIGLDGKKPFVKDEINDVVGSFYITRELIYEISENLPVQLIEAIKTTNVQDIRAMTTLVFQKK